MFGSQASERREGVRLRRRRVVTDLHRKRNCRHFNKVLYEGNMLTFKTNRVRYTLQGLGQRVRIHMLLLEEENLRDWYSMTASTLPHIS